MFKRHLAAGLLFAGLLGAWVLSVSGKRTQSDSPPPAQESWQKQFKEVCSKTQDAMTFSEEELTDLIRRCDALQPQIEKLDESGRKVYLGRLRMCRGLYAYVLDSKKNDKK